MIRCNHTIVAERTSAVFAGGTLVTCLYCARAFPSLALAHHDARGGAPPLFRLVVPKGVHDWRGVRIYNRSDAAAPERRRVVAVRP